MTGIYKSTRFPKNQTNKQKPWTPNPPENNKNTPNKKRAPQNYQVPNPPFCHSSWFLVSDSLNWFTALTQPSKGFLYIGAYCLLLFWLVPRSKHHEHVWTSDFSFWLLPSFTLTLVHHLFLFNSQNDNWLFLIFLVLGFGSPWIQFQSYFLKIPCRLGLTFQSDLVFPSQNPLITYNLNHHLCMWLQMLQNSYVSTLS